VPTPSRSTWLRSDHFIARSIAQPITRFLAIEAAGGILLFGAAVVALVWANSPWAAAYRDLWHTPVTIGIGEHSITEDLRHWINDGLMTLFFFVIGLEIKQEMTSGQLRSPRAAVLPAAGAVGGMALPALLFVRLNAGTAGADGWGIPMATDVAFALGVLALLGSRVPGQLKVLLLALAIVDDVGAIVVIAAFYTDALDFWWLVVALFGVVVIVGLRRVRVRYLPVYLCVGVVVWLAMFESGVHATIAGVVLGLFAPARPLLPPVDAERIADQLSADQRASAAEVREVSFRLREAVPVTERIQDLLHPWTSYVIVPLFALANAGIAISRESVAAATTSRITLGVVIGLVVGKTIGVAGAIWIVVRSGLGTLPDGLTHRHVLGMAMTAGIGFTVAIFITGLAFSAPSLVDQAKLGVLVASTLAAALGAFVLSRGSNST
jgi:NhaA family Na+:H+ antiporter